MPSLSGIGFSRPKTFDGGGFAQGTPQVLIYQSILQNTLEQTVLAFTIHMIWAVTMPQGWQGVTAVAAVLFFIGSVLFLRGYAKGAAVRTLGFGLTFYPSMFMLIMLDVHFIWTI